MLNDINYIAELSELIKSLNVKFALEVGSRNDELLNALKELEIDIAGISSHDQEFKSRKKPDLVFSSGYLSGVDFQDIPEALSNMIALTKDYILNIVPNSQCEAYTKCKATTDAPWKNELDFSVKTLEDIHSSIGLQVVKSGTMAQEWAKKFGPQPSEGYLVYVLARKVK